MAQYISKSALEAKIKEWRDKIRNGIITIPLSGKDKAYATFEYEILGKVIQFINRLEVKEVDLEKELDRYTNSAEYVYNETRDSYFLVAKHFFELGLKAQKGE